MRPASLKKPKSAAKRQRPKSQRILKDTDEANEREKAQIRKEIEAQRICEEEKLKKRKAVYKKYLEVLQGVDDAKPVEEPVNEASLMLLF